MLCGSVYCFGTDGPGRPQSVEGKVKWLALEGYASVKWYLCIRLGACLLFNRASSTSSWSARSLYASSFSCNWCLSKSSSFCDCCLSASACSSAANQSFLHACTISCSILWCFILILASLIICPLFARLANWDQSLLTDSSELLTREHLFDLWPLDVRAEGVRELPWMADLLQSMAGIATCPTAMLDALASIDLRGRLNLMLRSALPTKINKYDCVPQEHCQILPAQCQCQHPQGWKHPQPSPPGLHPHFYPPLVLSWALLPDRQYDYHAAGTEALAPHPLYPGWGLMRWYGGCNLGGSSKTHGGAPRLVSCAQGEVCLNMKTGQHMLHRYVNTNIPRMFFRSGFSWICLLVNLASVWPSMALIAQYFPFKLICWDQCLNGSGNKKNSLGDMVLNSLWILYSICLQVILDILIFINQEDVVGHLDVVNGLQALGNARTTAFILSILHQVRKQSLTVLNIIFQPLDKLFCVLWVPFDASTLWVCGIVFAILIGCILCLATTWFAGGFGSFTIAGVGGMRGHGDGNEQYVAQTLHQLILTEKNKIKLWKKMVLLMEHRSRGIMCIWQRIGLQVY